MSRWCRIKYHKQTFLGLAKGEQIALYQGDLLGEKIATGNVVSTDEVSWLPPLESTQFLGLWNNFYERMEFEGTRRPVFPLYFTKLPGSLAAHGDDIRRPAGFTSTVKFEAEIGVVIGQRCFQIDTTEIDDFIFGYTCINDVTAPEELKENDEFHQWCRSKSLPGFGPVGPWVATDVEPDELRVQAFLDGEIKQDYPVRDMIFSPREIVYHIAREIELLPGDVIACGTSVGAGAMQPGQIIEVNIEGIGRLRNRYLG